MEVLGRWWNGTWGRLVRRDVWLLRDTRWRVLARQGDSDTGKVLEWDFATADEARAMIDRLLKAEGPGDWKTLDHHKMSPPWGYGR